MNPGSPADKARQTVLRLLAMKDQSEEEIRRKLINRGYAEEQIEELFARFRELGYLDDVVYAMRQVRYLAQDKLYGDRRIEARLRDKGLAKDLVSRALDDVRSEFPEEEALEMRIRKLGPGQLVKGDAAAKRRLARSLMGKGFPPELIYEKLDTMLEDDSNGDDGR